SLIDEILDLSKIESGKMTVEMNPEEVDNIISAMRSLFGEMAKQKNLDLQFIVSESAPKVIITDRLRVEQILKNLLSNALKFTSSGYIHLSIQPTDNRAGYISIVVKDSGIGIAPDKQEHIFGAFQQADGSTRRKYGGTGLGLAISRELARILGGNLSVKSKVNSGSEFTLTLPIDVTKVTQKLEDTRKSEPLEKTPPLNETSADESTEQTFISTVIPADIPDDRAI